MKLFILASLVVAFAVAVPLLRENDDIVPDESIDEVFLISSCHLDVGFADTSINILNRYFDHFLIDAANTAKELREAGGEERLVFMTHSWVVWVYNNCEQLPTMAGLHCPNATTLATVNAAIAAGDIVMHAFPHNAQIETMDVPLFKRAIKLTQDLSHQLGVKAPRTLSQRDVPGMTRGVIPILREMGVEAISVGVNTASLPPAVPKAFVWRDKESDTELIALYHPFGYGGINPVDCVTIEGKALALGWRGDNAGPPAASEVRANFAQLKKQFPNAKIRAAKFDDFVDVISQVRHKLPVLTGEIGDTWIHGIASDPYKLAAHRTLQRFHAVESARRSHHHNDTKFTQFSNMILKNPEHTWGKDIKTFLHDDTNWSNDKFEAARSASNFLDAEASWVEQRWLGIDIPIQALGQDPLAEKIRAALAEFNPKGPIPLAAEGFTVVPAEQQHTSFRCRDWKLAFNAAGAISELSRHNSSFASSDAPFGSVMYETVTTADYNQFFADYAQKEDGKIPGYFPLDFGKPGLDSASPKHQLVTSKLTQLWKKSGDCEFVAQVALSEDCVKNAGGFALGEIVYKMQEDDSLLITFNVLNKTATRIPEALWFGFNTPGSRVEKESDQTPLTTGWRMNKLGSLISPLDVMTNGSRHMHAINEFVEHSSHHHDHHHEHAQRVRIESLDAALLSFGMSPFPTPRVEPDVSGGFSFCLVNNIWGTNYPMWVPFSQEPIEANMRFRFRVTFE